MITSPPAWVAFGTLLALEIVLGIDNVVFISILAGKLPANQQAKARYLGLTLAMVTRIILLFSISWMVRLTAPLFTVFGIDIAGRDLILIIGGLFLIVLIGMTLMAEGFDQHISKGYIYSAMAFSVFVEVLNLRAKKVAVEPVKLHEPYAEC